MAKQKEKITKEDEKKIKLASWVTLIDIILISALSGFGAFWILILTSSSLVGSLFLSSLFASSSGAGLFLLYVVYMKYLREEKTFK